MMDEKRFEENRMFEQFRHLYTEIDTDANVLSFPSGTILNVRRFESQINLHSSNTTRIKTRHFLSMIFQFNHLTTCYFKIIFGMLVHLSNQSRIEPTIMNT